MGANFIVTPEQGTFDVDAVRHYLDAQPDALRSPYSDEEYLLTGHPAAMSRSSAEWRANQHVVPRGALIEVRPSSISVLQEYADSYEMKSCLNLLEWLGTIQPYNIREDGYSDLTEQLKTGGVASLYPKWISSGPHEWTYELLQIGFFEDFFDSRGGVQAYQLKDCISEAPQEDEDKILAYLRSGHFYRAFGKPDEQLRDELDIDHELDLEPALFTDGTYVWPSDLPYYVERYHAHLPRAFLHHARQNGWQVPARVDVSSLKMVDV